VQQAAAEPSAIDESKMTFRQVRVAPKVLRFSPTQREQTLMIENGSELSVEFELAAHRSNASGQESVSVFQSNLPSGRLSAYSRERILIQFSGQFNKLDTDCVETLQLLLRNDQQELHLVVLDCEFELDETGASVIRSGKQIIRSDGLLLEEDSDAVYAADETNQLRERNSRTVQADRETNKDLTKRTEGGLFRSSLGKLSFASSYPISLIRKPTDKEGMRAINRIGRKTCFRRIGWLSRLVFWLNLILFGALVYIIFLSPASYGWNRLIHLYGLRKSVDQCVVFSFDAKNREENK
jgi:hypothetical protein